MLVSALEIAKSHARLPVNRDVRVIKQILRDWLHYTEHIPLRQKATFAATLRIEVRRSPPRFSTCCDGNKTQIHLDPVTRGFVAWREQCKGSSCHERDAATPLFACTESSAKRPGQQTKGSPHVFVKHFPFELWTALLPWEIQRGLSGSALVEPISASCDITYAPIGHVLVKKDDEETAARSHENIHKTDCNSPPHLRKVQGKEEEDVYGIVYAPPVKHTSNQRVAHAAGATSKKGNSLTNVGMLFVLDATSVQRQCSVKFWSGAIMHPIDVLFFNATPSTVVTNSASFRQFRRRGLAMSVADNEIAPDVATRFFPLDELRSSVTELRLHTYGHLDPFPECHKMTPSIQAEVQRHAALRDGKDTDEPQYFVEALFPPNADVSHIPRYVLEAPRHLLQNCVLETLALSWEAYVRTFDMDRASIRHDDGDTDIKVTLELSEDLKTDLMAKAQLYAHYVLALEENIEYHLRQLNAPCGTGAAHAATNSGGGRRVQVWFSGTQQTWMTPQEVAALGTGRAHESDLQDPGASEEEITKEEPEGAGAITYNMIPPLRHSVPNAGDETWSSARSSATPFVQLAQSGGTRHDCSIGHRSPTLAEEDEGRPTYLAPSFYGRHESGALQQHELHLNADKRARYPRTRPNMPQLPPIDYELLDLCLRLGVRQQVAIFYYYGRLLQEWRHELRRLDAASKKSIQMNSNPSAASTSDLSVLDVRRMLALVRDVSLEVPDELRSLVEEVAHLRQQRD